MKRKIHSRVVRHAARGLTQKQVREVLATVFRDVADGVKYEGRYCLPGVGTFIATTRKARTIRNPVTKELMQLPMTRGVLFRPSKRGVFQVKP